VAGAWRLRGGCDLRQCHHWKQVPELSAARKKDGPFDFWSIYPRVREKDRSLARRWMLAQHATLIAGIYLIAYRCLHP